MSRMTYRYGFVFMAVICVGLIATSARGGSLDSPAAPTNASSAMYTLEDVYNKLNTRTNVTKRTGAFTEPSSGPTAGTMHTLDNIMTLVTNRAPAPVTGQTTSYRTGDDGWCSTNVGVAWPNPRFAVQSDTNVVLDNLTGLMWTRNANLDGKKNWDNAIDYCYGLNHGGYDDWRLPNRQEILTLIDDGFFDPALCNTEGTAQWTTDNPFTRVQPTYYWLSTTYVHFSDYAWYVDMINGQMERDDKTETHYVWPVRGGGK